jgi:hypothetical protein
LALLAALENPAATTNTLSTFALDECFHMGDAR